MSETMDEGDKYTFGIDLENVNIRSYDDFENYDKIHIVMLTTTLPNPYTLVMFGVLKLFLEKIKEQYPNFNKMLHIDFLLIHEIAKYKKVKQLFEPITKHYDIFIPDELKEKSKEDALERYISSIIELRLNEIKTLINAILLNIVDVKGKQLVTKDNILNLNYEDIFHRSDKINSAKYPEVNSLMDSEIKMLKSPLLRELLFEKVDPRKENLVNCLLKIFCDELPPTNEKKEGKKPKAIFFVIDRWFKEMIKDIFEKPSKSSNARFEEIYKRLVCPSNDPPVSEEKELDLYLNQISKYEAAGIGLNEGYFSSLLRELSCRLFDEPFDGFYYMVSQDHSAYREKKKNQKEGTPLDEMLSKYEEKNQNEYPRMLNKIITKGFLTVQEEILIQLTYIQ
jgi:hypothetical protein